MSEAPIPPALTPDEWAAHRAHQQVIGYDAGEPDDQHRAMALANDALPDDDPRKITRADVAELRAAARAAESAARYMDPCYQDHEALSALAEKLAALIPPEAP